jgi:hypothetical protein
MPAYLLVALAAVETAGLVWAVLVARVASQRPAYGPPVGS